MKRTVHIYGLTDGVFSHSLTVHEDDIAKNLAPGEAAYEGRDVDAGDYQTKRVDLLTGRAVAWRAPAPVDDVWQTWQWNAAARRWHALPTDAAIAAGVRAARDQRLSLSDWIVARSIERAEPVPAAWLAYRQALRDVPAQPGFPDAIDWPTPPAA